MREESQTHLECLLDNVYQAFECLFEERNICKTVQIINVTTWIIPLFMQLLPSQDHNNTCAFQVVGLHTIGTHVRTLGNFKMFDWADC